MPKALSALPLLLLLASCRSAPGPEQPGLHPHVEQAAEPGLQPPAGRIAGAERPAAAWALRTLSELPPPQGLRVLAENAAYSRECGACHYPLNPSLLPAASWAGLMTNLADHFGDNASLDQQTTRELTMWLVANAAETWDTESANRFRLVAREEPFRVTAMPYWVRKHSDIPGSVFASPPVRSKVNCNACHSDAETGRYDDQAIKMPKEEKP